MASNLEAGSPQWWLDRLGKRLWDRQPEIRRQEAYYEGVHPLKFMTDRFRDAFGGMFRQFADNWLELVVDAVEERLKVEGFRFGDDPAADGDAWRIWQENNLDAESRIAHSEALKHGVAFLLVGEDGRITPEHPAEVLTAHEAGDRRAITAGVKMWVDDWDDHARATLWLPVGVFRFRSKGPQTTGAGWTDLRWEDPGETPNPLGVVPLIPLVNRPGLMRPFGKSEIANVIPTQDAVNKLVVDMVVAAHFSAFRQKWATGIEIPTDEEGRPVEAFKEAVDRVWHTAAPDAKFGEFAAADLDQYVKAIEMLVQHIASQTRTPPHYFYLRGQMPSGESIKSAETGLVAKAKDRMVHFGESWEQALRLSFKAKGDPRASVSAAETIWGDPESRTESEMVDAALKRQAMGVPRQQLWEDIGYSPTQVSRFEAMRIREALGGEITRGIGAVEPSAPVG